MPKRIDSRVVVREYRPWRQWCVGLLLVVLGGVVGWLFPTPLAEPLASAPSENTQPLPSVQNPRQLIARLARENTRLRESLAQIRWKLVVEHQTRLGLGSTINTLQSEILKLKNQLATYKSLMRIPQAPGLHIHSLTLNKTDRERLFRYCITLTRGGERDQLAQGRGRLFIYGVRNGKYARLALSRLSKKAPFTFEFKYFQIIEGELLLPNNFKPTRIEVTLFPGDNPSMLVERVFDWPSPGASSSSSYPLRRQSKVSRQ